MRGTYHARNPEGIDRRAVTRRILGVVLVVTAAIGLVVWAGGSEDAAPPAGDGLAGLDAQARCDRALPLVTHPDRWPVRCRWRQPGEVLQGQAFPPPEGPPPYDDPHVEIYVTPTQTEEQLANAIAHELGHMHHTREPRFVPDWLSARNLPPGTPDAIWAEDYAEVFATLFSPPASVWRSPTPRPSPEALATLKVRFFA